MHTDDGDWSKARALFLELLDLPAEARDAFLEGACAEAPDMRDKVGQLLEAHEGPPLEIEEVLQGLGRAARAEREQGDQSGRDGGSLGPLPRDTRLGAYRTVALIGAGGMGEVYEAVRDDGQFEQRVAIKVLRQGYATAELVRRFQIEREILARLEHASIVRIADGGLTPDGRPYLVMEYVDGVPLTRYCHDRSLTTDERLRLFVRVCSTVQYAHGQLVVHRDLKPSNILVTPSGDPKLLDFGIAKLLSDDADPHATDSPELTRPGGRIMTPHRAAPEQLRGQPVTTATDVYALGLLLGELVLGDPLPRNAKLTDVRTIAAKATAEEPSRRYASAGQLGDDVERYLAGLPVLARPASLGYRVHRFVTRNRMATALMLAFTAMISGFALVSATQARRIAAERDVAQRERVTAERVVGILTGLFDRSNPLKVPGGDTVRVAALIGDAIVAIDGVEDPAVQARLWQAVAQMQVARSDYQGARELFARAHTQWVTLAGPYAPEAALAEYELARAVVAAEGNYEGRPALEEAVHRLTEVFGPSDTLVADAWVALALATTDPDARRTLFDRAVSMEPDATEGSALRRASRLNSKGMLESEEGRNDRALLAFQESARVLRSALPPDHSNVLAVETNIAGMLARLGRFDEAERIQRSTLERTLESMGDETRQAAVRTMNLGVTLAHAGRLAESEETFRLAHRRLEGVLEPTHPTLASNLRNLGLVAAQRGRLEEGLGLIREAVAMVDTVPGAEVAAAGMRGQLGRMLVRSGAAEDGEALLGSAETQLERFAPPLSWLRAEIQSWLGIAALEGGRPREAVARFERALALHRLRPEALSHPSVSEARCGLTLALSSGGSGVDGPADGRPTTGACEAYSEWGLAEPTLVQRALPVPPAARPPGSTLPR